MNTKIIVALVIAFALVGLTGAASASMFDSQYSDFSSSYVHTSGFLKSSITSHTDITDYQSPRVFESPTASGYLEASYTSTFNGVTISESTVDNIPPYHIAEDIPFNGAIFHFEAFASVWP